MVMIKIVVMDPFRLLVSDTLFFFLNLVPVGTLWLPEIQSVWVMGPLKAQNVNLMRYIAYMHMATNS